MRRRWPAVIVALVLVSVASACGDDGRALAPAPPTTATVPSTAAPAVEPTSLQLASPDVAEGAALDARFTCDGAGDAPRLLITGAPPAVAELAIAVVDVDAGGAVHWVVAGLPPGVEVVEPSVLPDGAVAGTNVDRSIGWAPPCPPPGDAAHRYELRLYALASPSGLVAGADGRDAVDALEQAALERDVLTATYARP
ncbi:MAG: YbhB/YbcL family Raf kinase inhibitor-like protein [Acidimicrobiia bacterium]